MSFVKASNSGITSCPLNAFTMITMLGLITLHVKRELSSGQIWNRLILLELVEVQLDVVNSIDGAKCFPSDHPQSLHERSQSWVSAEDPHLFKLLK